MRPSAFETYQTFLALKYHFNGKYDYFKYHGKVNTSLATFSNKPDKYQYQKLSREVSDHPDLVRFLVSNFIEGTINWVGDAMNDECQEIYMSWKKRNQSLTYNFKNEIETAFQSIDDVKNIASVLYEFRLNLKASIETFCIVNSFIPFFDRLDTKLGKDDYIWSKMRDTSLKYFPFIDYDKEKFKTLLLTHLKTLNNT